MQEEVYFMNTIKKKACENVISYFVISELFLYETELLQWNKFILYYAEFYPEHDNMDFSFYSNKS